MMMHLRNYQEDCCQARPWEDYHPGRQAHQLAEFPQVVYRQARQQAEFHRVGYRQAHQQAEFHQVDYRQARQRRVYLAA
jgi:hypothetical protein